MTAMKVPPNPTFEEVVEMAREIMLRAGEDAAKMLGEPPPKVREEKTMNGVRLVTVWPDGAETNEAVIQRLDDQAQVSE